MRVKLFSELNTLLFPVRCYGCRELGQPICSRCRKLWYPHRYQSQASELLVFSAIAYSPVAKSILLAAKEENLKSADKLLITALTSSVLELFKKFGSFTLVPIPSQASANRRRGRDFIAEITSEVAKECGLSALPLLEHRRRVQDQSKLNIAGRRENLAMALTVKAKFQGQYSTEKVVILDDLITTGATIREANRALNKAGFQVRAAATACVALRRRE